MSDLTVVVLTDVYPSKWNMSELAMASLIHLLPLPCDFRKTATLSDLSECHQGKTDTQLLFNMYVFAGLQTK